MGGANGTSNTQAKQLANRTRWLKEQTENQGSRIASMEGGIDEQAQNAATGTGRAGERMGRSSYAYTLRIAAARLYTSKHSQFY
jgi:hypothetical protein